MSESSILESTEVTDLEMRLEEATRASSSGVRRFIEPAAGTLQRAISRSHHIVFGRRGSGKSSLLRKAAQDLTVDRRPMAFVDLESYKGHEYPDVLISILIETFGKFADWLETAAIAPANKTTFWKRLFGKNPTRPPFDKIRAQALSTELRKQLVGLREQLFSEDNIDTEETHSGKTANKQTTSGKLTLGTKDSNIALGADTSASSEIEREEKSRYVRSKVNFLHRHILDYQSLFREMSVLSAGDAYLFLDDLYHIPRKYQAQVLDYFHRVAKGNSLWLKVGTIKHRTLWYLHGDPPVGTKIGDDINEIDLDLTLEKYKVTSAFLEKILINFLEGSQVNRAEFLVQNDLPGDFRTS
jgi:hypothetical protein